MTVSGELDGIKFYGASLVMDSRVAVRYYFVADSIADVHFTANGNTYNADEKSGLFYVEIPDILPQNYSQNILLTAQKGDEKLEISYSPLTYIVRMSEKGSATMQALVKAMYGYHQAAVSYLNNRVSFSMYRNTEIAYFSSGEEKFEKLKEELKKAVQ